MPRARRRNRAQLLHQETMPGAEAELAFGRENFYQASRSRADQLARLSGSRVIVVTGPSQMQKPSATRLPSARRSRQRNIAAYADAASICA